MSASPLQIHNTEGTQAKVMGALGGDEVMRVEPHDGFVPSLETPKSSQSLPEDTARRHHP